MAKRVESFQADCLDGGSTPPSSTKKERTKVLSFFVEPNNQPYFYIPPKSPFGKVGLLGSYLETSYLVYAHKFIGA